MYGSGQENSTVLALRALAGEEATMAEARTIQPRIAATMLSAIRTTASVSVSDFGSSNEECYKGS